MTFSEGAAHSDVQEAVWFRGLLGCLTWVCVSWQVPCGCASYSIRTPKANRGACGCASSGGGTTWTCAPWRTATTWASWPTWPTHSPRAPLATQVRLHTPPQSPPGPPPLTQSLLSTEQKEIFPLRLRLFCIKAVTASLPPPSPTFLINSLLQSRRLLALLPFYPILCVVNRMSLIMQFKFWGRFHRISGW